MRRTRPFWHDGIRIGLIGGVAGILLALIGMVEAFSQKNIISDVISMGHSLLLLLALSIGYLAGKRGHESLNRLLINGLLSGSMIGGSLALLVVVGNLVRLRAV